MRFRVPGSLRINFAWVQRSYVHTRGEPGNEAHNSTFLSYRGCHVLYVFVVSAPFFDLHLFFSFLPSFCFL